MKAYGYIRVSSKGQVEGDGDVRQEQAIREFCLRFSLPLACCEFEQSPGAVEAMDRPSFSQMLAECQSGDCIVVERMDRLARDLMVQELLLKECRSAGVFVYAADQGELINVADEGGDPTRKLIRQIMGALAEWEKNVIVKKLRAARDRKRIANGRCEGPLPYGVSSMEKHIVGIMAGLRKLNGEWQGIADVLNRQGLLTRTGKAWSKHTALHAYQQAKKAVSRPHGNLV